MTKQPLSLNRRSLLYGMAAVGAGGLLTACGGDAGSGSGPSAGGGKLPSSLKSLSEKASKEGKLRLFVSTDSRTPAHARKLSRALHADTGVNIDITFVSGEPDPSFANKLVQESKAQVAPSIDVFATTPLVVKQLSGAGLIQQVDWGSMEGVDANDIWTQYQGIYIAEIARTVLYNTKAVKAADAPKSLEDLLTDKWRGKIVTAGLPDVFSPLAAGLGVDKMLDFVRRLLEGDRASMASVPTAIRTQVSSGEFPIGYGIRIGESQRAAKAPVDYAPIKVPVVPRAGLVIKGAKNPSAAQLFLYWLNATDEGRKKAFEVLDWPRYTTPGTDLHALAQKAGGVMTADIDWWMNDYEKANRQVAQLLRK
ncbi:ABC transporter substrate-binding protein [Streptomyces albipurpureus]|uniref:Extracellular solute-binding protein n=1 Tax=Streptomyces albipurpureus TaxID=2897419 RepID=A0ABT0UPR9_9ACTN|nr:extracellular solute-binding protein [Streptomyces sp. CWNU-1]MCM2390619.1 extracellular solute-binding protein [Streptomyces sp. CWNU-1]